MWALENSCLANYDHTIHASTKVWQDAMKRSPVRIQWDPEKDIFLQPLPYRSIQIGLSGIAVEKYLAEWITDIDDITGQCKNIHHLINTEKIAQAKDLLPVESFYPISDALALKIDATAGTA